MNKEKPPITGRTKFDWMSENKDILNKIIIILFLILLIIIGIISIVVFKGKHNIKAGTDGIEISPIEVPQSNIDEINTDSKSFNTKDKEPIKSEKITSQSSKIELQTGDTSIRVENQPSNINLGNNSVVGNNINSTITINPKEKLTDDEKKKLIKDLNLAFRAANRSNKSCAMLVPEKNHPKALELIEDIKPFLTREGYNIVERNVGVYLGNPNEPNKISFKANEEGECLYIIISFKD